MKIKAKKKVLFRYNGQLKVAYIPDDLVILVLLNRTGIYLTRPGDFHPYSQETILSMPFEMIDDQCISEEKEKLFLSRYLTRGIVNLTFEFFKIHFESKFESFLEFLISPDIEQITGCSRNDSISTLFLGFYENNVKEINRIIDVKDISMESDEFEQSEYQNVQETGNVVITQNL